MCTVVILIFFPSARDSSDVKNNATVLFGEALERGFEQVDDNGAILQWHQYKSQTHNTVSVKYECDYSSA
jgi:hypothetical protein